MILAHMNTWLLNPYYALEFLFQVKKFQLSLFLHLPCCRKSFRFAKTVQSSSNTSTSSYRIRGSIPWSTVVLHSALRKSVSHPSP